MTNLLIVDWSIAFPDATWLPSEEDRFFHEAVWRIRAQQMGGPSMRPDETVRGFWSRFRFARRAELLYADQGMYAAHERVREGVTAVWLYSPRHAAGYTHDAIERLMVTKEVGWANWMLVYAATDVEMHQRYPSWLKGRPDEEGDPSVPFDRAVDDGQPRLTEFDRVFVFKSPSTTPAWCDPQYRRFLAAVPLRRRQAIDDSVLVRTFSESEPIAPLPDARA